MRKFKINTEEPELVSEIIKQVKSNGGYCPCKVLHNEDTKCMCKEFKEQFKNGKLGLCHCGLYEIIEE